MRDCFVNLGIIVLARVNTDRADYNVNAETSRFIILVCSLREGGASPLSRSGRGNAKTPRGRALSLYFSPGGRVFFPRALSARIVTPKLDIIPIFV